MERKISLSLYLTALVVTAIIFSIGILVGLQASDAANAVLQKELDKLSTQTASLELLLLLQSNESLCGFFESQARQFSEETAEFGFKLEFLEKNRGYQDVEVIELKSLYSLKEARDYLLLQKINSACGKQFDTILFFYSNKQCAQCLAQGQQLTELKKTAPDEIMVYSFDTDLDATIVKALKEAYGVTTVPSVVVNSKTFPGFKTRQQLQELLG